MLRIENIIFDFKSYTNNQIDCSPIQKAYILAVKTQKPVRLFRQSNLQTSLEVAQVLIEMRLDIQSVVSGLLYRILFEGDIKCEELRDLMGSETAAIIEAINDLLQTSPKTDEKQEQAQNMRQMIFATTKDIRVLFVSLAVRLVQLRHWSRFFQEGTKNLASQTLATYAPIADRLGLSHIKVELEDLSFSLLHPKVFKQIQIFCKQGEEDHQLFLKNLIDAILALLQNNQITSDVKGRIKHYYSIYRKANKLGGDYENLHDLLGIRIVTHNIGDCYKALGLIHSNYQPVAERFKDYISFPKPNGYQSLHTMIYNGNGVGFEVQIRTEEMDRVAELGIAAHWVYKANSNITPQENDATFWLANLTKSLNVTTDPRESLEIFTRELYSDFVYVFTPRGKIIKLPVEASVIDFAYEIHSEIGNSCVGAQINGKHCSIKTILKHGDNVEILTDKNQHPTHDWLKFAITSRALSQIRNFLRKKEKQEALKLGQEIFLEQTAKIGLKFKLLENNQHFKEFMEEHKYNSLEEYYSFLGFGKANIISLIDYFKEDKEKLPVNLKQRITKALPAKKQAVRIAGIDNIMVSYANCCKPVKGDPVMGVVTRGQGLSIHLKECDNIRLLEINPERLVDVQWIKTSSEKLPVTLKLHYNDQIKTSLQIMKILASAKVTLIENNSRLVKNLTHQDILIRIDNVEILDKILKKLNGISSVKAYRMQETNTPN